MDEPRRSGTLDSRARSLLDNAREARQLPADVEDRVWTRVRRSVWKDRMHGPLIVMATTMAAAAAVLLVVATLGQEDAVSSPTPARSEAAFETKRDRAADTVESRSVRPVQPPNPSPSATPSPASPATPSDDDPRVRVRPTPGSKRAPTKRTRPSRSDAVNTAQRAAADTLTEETRLLEAARRALTSGQPGLALLILERSASRFPAPVLGEEREALHAMALCNAGRLEEGRSAAREFLHRHPSSAVRASVRRACELSESR